MLRYFVYDGPTTGKPKTLYEHLEYCIYKCCMFLGFQCWHFIIYGRMTFFCDYREIRCMAAAVALNKKTKKLLNIIWFWEIRIHVQHSDIENV